MKNKFFINSTLMMGVGATVAFGSGAREKFEIIDDPQMLAGKQNYLQQLREFEQKRAAVSQEDNRPNIVWIVVDDLGKYDCSLYDDTEFKGLVNTPYLEQLANSGALFTEGMVSAPICSPSRAGMLTGRQQQRFGFEYRLATIYPTGKGMKQIAESLFDLGAMHMSEETLFPNHRQMRLQGIPKSEIHISEALQASGYKTALVGKWDVGYTGERIPEFCGYDSTYGFLEAYTLFSRINDPNVVNSRQDNFQNKFIWMEGRSGTSAIFRNGKRIIEKEYLTFALSRESIAIINEQSEAKKNGKGREPFFLYTSFNAPHTPFQAPLRYYDLFPEELDHNKRVYYAMIKSLDDAIGDILHKLERAGELENTLICFTSDNGGAEYTLATENGPLKAGKFSNFEGAINVPFIVSYPNKIKPGQLIKEPVSALDFYATSLGVAGIPLAADRKFDGVDIVDALRTESLDPDREFFWRAGYNKYMRRGAWKLILNDKSGQRELFHLVDDKYERYNLKEKHPKLFAELRSRYQEWESEMKPEAWPHVMDYAYEIDGETYYFAL